MKATTAGAPLSRPARKLKKAESSSTSVRYFLPHKQAVPPVATGGLFHVAPPASTCRKPSLVEAPPSPVPIQSREKRVR